MLPNGVHRFIISGPNTASLAILRTSLPIVASFFREEFLLIITSIGRSSLVSMAVLVNVPSVLNVFLMGTGDTGDRRGVEDAVVDRGCEVDCIIGDVAKHRETCRVALGERILVVVDGSGMDVTGDSGVARGRGGGALRGILVEKGGSMDDG